MNTVTFPGLGLKFEVSRVAFNIFGIDVYCYAICIVVGIILALILCKKSEDNYYIKFDCVLETTLFAVIFGIIGARLYYVIFNLGYYLSNPLKIFNIRDGGLAIYGGLIAGAYTVYKFSKKYKVKFVELLDYMVPFVALVQCIGRWGNFFNMEAYGYATTSFLRMGLDLESGYIEVHPVFLYESIADLIIFIILRKLQPKRKFEGQIMYTYLFLYSGVRMFLENLRVDSLLFLGFRISKGISIIVFVVSGVILLKRTIKCALQEHSVKKADKKRSKNVN